MAVEQMSEREQFLWDLNGFIVVPGLLSLEEVAALNAAIDANRDRIVDDANRDIGSSTTLAGERDRQILNGLLTLPGESCDPFRRLLAHPAIRPYLNSILGEGWRVDHDPACFIAQKGARGLVFHGAGQKFFGPSFYAYNNGRSWSGMIAAEWVLTPVGPGDGGFAFVPGSHKSNFWPPQEISEWEQDRDLVRHVACQPGDLVIFNEATMHGTLPWTADHERRALLYRYSPKWLHWAGGTFTYSQPEWLAELGDAERAVLEPPYVYERPVIQDDGAVVRR
jgi:hypothetical protein